MIQPCLRACRPLLLVLLATPLAAFQSQSGPQVGYAVIDPSGQPPVAGAILSFRKDGQLVWEAGVPAVEPVSAGRLFASAGVPEKTGIALANLSGNPVRVNLEVRDANGLVKAETHIMLQAGDHRARFTDELDGFSTQGLPAPGSLTFRTDPPEQEVAVLTLLQNLNRHGEEIVSTLSVAHLHSASQAPAATSPIVFPHIGAGSSCQSAELPESCLELSTRIILINPSQSRICGRLEFFDGTGDTLPVEIAEGPRDGQDCPTGTSQPSGFPFGLPPDGILSWLATGGGDLAVGYAAVAFEGDVAPVGTALFQLRDGLGGLMSEAGVGAVRKTSRVRIFVESTQETQTGVALSAFESDEPTSLEFTLLDRNGEAMQQRRMTLAAGNHLAIFAAELFDDPSDPLPGGFQGLLDIQASQPVFAITLKQTAVARGRLLPDLILTTLPLADLDRPLADHTSLAFPQIGFGGGLSTRFILINTQELQPARGSLRFPEVLPPDAQGLQEVPFEIVAGGLGQLAAPHPFFSRIDFSEANPAPLEIDLTLLVDEQGQTLSASELALLPQAFDSLGRRPAQVGFEYRSLDPAVAEVDSEGLLRAREGGWSTLTVRAGGVEFSAFVKVVRIKESAQAGLVDIRGMANDGEGRSFLASRARHSIWRVEDSQLDLYAGNPEGMAGFLDKARLQSLFNRPSFVALNRSSNQILVSDASNHVIRLLHPGEGKEVETLAGEPEVPGCLDGPARQARFNNPQGIVQDGLGRIWVADSSNQLIRLIDEGTVRTIAGIPPAGCEVDLPPSTIAFNNPSGLALYPAEEPGGVADSVIVADTGNGAIRRVTDDGKVETLPLSAPGGGAAPRFNNPMGPFESPISVAVDFSGNVHFSEPQAGRVRTILKTGDIVDAFEQGAAGAASPTALAILSAGSLQIAGEDGALAQVNYEPPDLQQAVPDAAPEAGGTSVELRGRHFGPETEVVVGGRLIEQAQVIDSQTIRFITPPLPSGLTEVSVRQRGGIDQIPFYVRPSPLLSQPPGYIVTVAGGGTFQGDGRQAAEAQLDAPRGLAIDPLGNLYLADSQHHRVRRIEASTGIIHTLAGTGRAGFSGDGGSALAAALNSPLDVAVDSQGNILVADTGNSRIRRIDTATGRISTVAGNGCDPEDPQSAPCQLGDGESALQATLLFPEAVDVDEQGRIYIADTENQRIRIVEGGMIETIAGGGTKMEDDSATSVALNFPADVAAGDEQFYIADWGNHKIRLAGLDGAIRTVAGTGSAGFSGDGGAADQAELARPLGVAVDSLGNLYVADTGNLRVRRVENGIISTIIAPPSGAQNQSHALLSRALVRPSSVAVDGAGRIFLADSGSDQILLLSSQGVAEYAGSRQQPFLGDGEEAGRAIFQQPRRVAVDPQGNLYIADTQNHRIRMIEAGSQLIHTVAGTGSAGFNQTENPAEAMLNSPQGLALDGLGNLFIADTGNHVIRRLDLAGRRIVTVVGLAGDGGDNGDNSSHPLSTRLLLPRGIAFDGQGILLIADTNNHKVRRADFGSDPPRVDTVAGTGEPGIGPGDLFFPSGITADPRQGTIYAADTGNQRIVQIDPQQGTIEPLAGGGQSPGDGPGDQIRLLSPESVNWLPDGSLLISETFGHRIRKLDLRTRQVTTLVGRVQPPQTGSFPFGEGSFCGDRGPADLACLSGPHGIAIDGQGNLFIADAVNRRIRAVKEIN